MNENPTAYAAMITISLPGTDKTATASVRVLPDESVALPAGAKLLRDCTLAELQTFANTWEAEVWETYQHINLLELHTDETVQVEVVLIAQDGEQALADWAERAIVLTTEVSVEAEDAPETMDEPTVSEEAAVEETEAEEETAVPQEAEPAPEPTASTETTPPPTPETPEVIVSESEPVYADEAEALESVKQPQLPPRPQVRIAGQRLPLSRASWASANIFIEEPALRQAQAHALSSPSREVAGVLVGPHPEKQPDGRYNVYI
ncbi:MAG: hypothetical protein KC415_12550, partial [Anaerolineales bacterium]|nr:hypothetical protein [Anaerolineales bacterium]